LFEIESFKFYGLKAELLPLPAGRLKAALEAAIPDGVARLMTNKLRMGSFLVAHMSKR